MRMRGFDPHFGCSVAGCCDDVATGGGRKPRMCGYSENGTAPPVGQIGYRIGRRFSTTFFPADCSCWHVWWRAVAWTPGADSCCCCCQKGWGRGGEDLPPRISGCELVRGSTNVNTLHPAANRSRTSWALRATTTRCHQPIKAAKGRNQHGTATKPTCCASKLKVWTHANRALLRCSNAFAPAALSKSLEELLRCSHSLNSAARNARESPRHPSVRDTNTSVQSAR
jgi:hypothetical protein